MCGAAASSCEVAASPPCDGEVGGDAVVHLESAVVERVGEAARAVLRERQRVDAGDLGDDGVGVVAELLADVGAGADAHAVVVTEDGGARGERCSRTRGRR